MELITFEGSNEILKITSLRNNPDPAEEEMQDTELSLDAFSVEEVIGAQALARKHADASDKYPNKQFVKIPFRLLEAASWPKTQC